MAFITINGREFPPPDNMADLIVATNVSDGKNALGEFIGDRVGRDQYKVDNLQWSYLTPRPGPRCSRRFRSS